MWKTSTTTLTYTLTLSNINQNRILSYLLAREELLPDRLRRGQKQFHLSNIGIEQLWLVNSIFLERHDWWTSHRRPAHDCKQPGVTSFPSWKTETSSSTKLGKSTRGDAWTNSERNPFTASLRNCFRYSDFILLSTGKPTSCLPKLKWELCSTSLWGQRGMVSCRRMLAS